MKERIKEALIRQGFSVVDYSSVRASVDYVARKDKTVLIIKILGSVEALKPEHAEDMLRLANLLDGMAILVTSRSRWGPLERGIVYHRYGVPTMSPETFLDYIGGEAPGGVYTRGKEIVPIDKDLLRRRREELGLSLQKLAELANTTKETIYRYERGFYGSMDTVKRIERVLGVKIRKSVEPKPGSVPEEVHPPFTALREKGGRVSEFKRLPWEVLARRRIAISFIREGRGGSLRRRVALLERGRGSIFHYYLVLGKKRRGLPYIEEEEILDASSFKDIEKIARERNEER